ncbi:PREDICTED: charged multivesicular body protein 1b-like [Amphimedon queenslandica]|uniref:Charged multivesicular body protein 1b n=1 Tax=Amphimedon queenslandica TaxID=400682 RepID=A0A1X7V0P9_AMPQE|nr:PREDICTED: charged multivesicular body protein 1b-like [Amphimedon queenslandica]|eukprot:XP_003386145.1 PREDICTED: charged multivesicular body protein 1b-like [Amphimedon queenslandica]
MEKHLFNLKFAAKQMAREAKKCEKAEKEEKAKLKKALAKGNVEGARIHAENAIRQKNQGLNFLRMSARVDGVASRVQTAVTTKNVTKALGGVVKSMESAMKSMNLEKISKLMEQFERDFEHLDVQTQTMDEAMSGVTTLTIPEDQVQGLMEQARDEAGLELDLELPTAGTATHTSAEQDELTARLAQLRNS